MAKQIFKSWKEERRFRAIDLLKQGWTQKQVATAFGVKQNTVSTWKILHEKQGESGLLLQGHLGKRSSLTLSQKSQLCTYLDEGAEAQGFEGDFWTQKRVSRLIFEKFSIELKPRTCGDLLKALDYKLKTPQLKSYDQNPEKIKEWKEVKIPEIKKKAKERNALIFYVDESSFKLLPNVVKSYFRKGTKAVLKYKLVRKALNVISGIAPSGKLIYHLRNSGFKGIHMADFLRKILRTFPRRKIIVIWDGAPNHSSQEVKDYLRTLQPGRLELFKQPAHSPELNPDEQVWKYLKAESSLRNLACKSFKELRQKLLNEIENLENNSDRIIKMFYHPECAFY